MARDDACLLIIAGRCYIYTYTYCYCALLFVTDIAPSVLSIRLDLKILPTIQQGGGAQSYRQPKWYRVRHKSATFERGHRPILKKIHFGNRHIISHRMECHLFSMNDLPTNQP